jgi:hypothetical protein
MGIDKLKIINDIKPQDRPSFTYDDFLTRQGDKKKTLERLSSKVLTPTQSKLSFSAHPQQNFKSFDHQPVFKPTIDNTKAVLMRKDSERIFKNPLEELKQKHGAAKRKLSQQEILLKHQKEYKPGFA